MEIINSGIFARTTSGKKVKFDSPSTFALLIESESRENRWLENVYCIFSTSTGKKQIGTMVLNSHRKYGAVLLACSDPTLLFIDPLENGPFGDD